MSDVSHACEINESHTWASVYMYISNVYKPYGVAMTRVVLASTSLISFDIFVITESLFACVCTKEIRTLQWWHTRRHTRVKGYCVRMLTSEKRGSMVAVCSLRVYVYTQQCPFLKDDGLRCVWGWLKSDVFNWFCCLINRIISCSSLFLFRSFVYYSLLKLRMLCGCETSVCRVSAARAILICKWGLSHWHSVSF